MIFAAASVHLPPVLLTIIPLFLLILPHLSAQITTRTSTSWRTGMLTMFPFSLSWTSSSFVLSGRLGIMYRDTLATLRPMRQTFIVVEFVEFVLPLRLLLPDLQISLANVS